MVAVSAFERDEIRMIDADDLEAVLGIDRAHTKQSRRRFFAKRFAQAAAHPAQFVQIGFARGGSLRGFAIAHLMQGQFGREELVAVLDALGVELESQSHGMGQLLIDHLRELLQQRGVRVLHSQASWKSHDLLRFFDRCGFALSSRVVLERSVAEPLIEPVEELP
jgi:GNAT superfamily N-acetyltransferase